MQRPNHTIKESLVSKYGPRTSHFNNTSFEPKYLYTYWNLEHYLNKISLIVLYLTQRPHQQF